MENSENKDFNYRLKQTFAFFFQGLLYIGPIALTIYIFVLAFQLVDGIIPVGIPGLGILVIFVSVTLTGIIGQRLLSKPFVAYFNYLLNKAPLFKIVYSSIKDLISAFVGKEKKFNQPVLVKVSKVSNLEKLGFITQTDVEELGLGKGKVAVYFPHSYAFTGELFIAPAEDVSMVDIPAAEVMKFIISGGITRI